MRDLLPEETRIRDYLTHEIAAIYRRWGFQRIETPALERIEFLTAGQGGENEKLIFKVLKRGEKLDLAAAAGEDDLVDAGLRFDLTVPLTRFVASHGSELPMPFKALQIGSVWRAERPQRGRFRQFTQCDIDIIGLEAPFAEVELIMATSECLTALGLRDFTVKVNDRRLLAALAASCGFSADQQGAVFIALDKFDKVGLDGVKADLTGFDERAVGRLLDILSQSGQARSVGEFARNAGINAGIETPGSTVAELEEIIGRTALPPESGARVVFDPLLIRGMGYYTGAVFEVWHKDYPFSMAGGGRYDKMIGRWLGREVPACGFSIGFERLVTELAQKGIAGAAAPRRIAMLFEDGGVFAAQERARGLRTGDTVVSVLPRAKRMGHQLEELRKQGYSEAWLVGNDGARQLSFEQKAQ
jgi:histidyl-tRNA synthetase